MMAKSKENVSEMSRSVSYDEALELQERIGEHVQFLLNSTSGSKNPANAPQREKPRLFDSRGKR